MLPFRCPPSQPTHRCAVRRILNWFAVFVLSCSIVTDAARAGWHHRRQSRAVGPDYGHLIEPEFLWCEPVAWVIVAEAAAPCCEMVACPEPVGCCGAGTAATGGPLVHGLADHSLFEEPVTNGVIASDSVSTPEAHAESVLVAEADGEDLTASGETSGEPVVHDPLRMEAPDTRELVEKSSEAAPSRMEPEPVNLFEVDEASEAEAAAEAAVSDNEPIEPSAGSPTEEVESEDRTAPVAKAEADELAEPEMADDELALDPDTGDEPVAETDDDLVFDEPDRRWIHARGDRSLVARLVGMPAAGTCLLEAGGRQIAVPLHSLSSHDRAYVDRVGERLAAAQALGGAGDTAGL